MSCHLSAVTGERNIKTGVLSGPSFAKEVAAGLPTAVTVASQKKEAAIHIQRALSTPLFRVYAATDVIGLELGGALKNIVAIGAGICDGLGYGTNTRAALITRGLAEISRLGVSMGADPLTFSGLGGLGDLVLTCTGDLSRNRMVGLKLGQGKKLSDDPLRDEYGCRGGKDNALCLESCQKGWRGNADPGTGVSGAVPGQTMQGCCPGSAGQEP